MQDLQFGDDTKHPPENKPPKRKHDETLSNPKNHESSPMHGTQAKDVKMKEPGDQPVVKRKRLRRKKHIGGKRGKK